MSKIIKKGSKVIVTDDGSGSMTPVGTKLTIDKVIGNIAYYKFNGLNCSKNFNCLKVINSTVKELEKDLLDIDKEIIALNTEKESIRSKIQFMEDNELEIYDEDTFKAFSTLSLLDNNKLSKIEKAKLISKLIKG